MAAQPDGHLMTLRLTLIFSRKAMHNPLCEMNFDKEIQEAKNYMEDLERYRRNPNLL